MHNQEVGVTSARAPRLGGPEATSHYKSPGRKRTGLLLSAVCGSLLSAAFAQAPATPSFEEVAVIFEARCVMCHSGDGAPVGLRLDSYEGVMAGSSRGAVVLPGDPEESELVKRIEGRSQPRMPLTGPPFLDDAQISLIRDWIAAGAPAAQGAATGEEGAPAGQDAVGSEADAPGTSEATTEAAEAAPAPAGTTFASVEDIFMSRCAGCLTDGGIRIERLRTR